MTRWLLCLALLLAPVAAPAKWFEASSDHFVIYADQAPREIERFSQQLEQFHDAMFIPTAAPPPTWPGRYWIA